MLQIYIVPLKIKPTPDHNALVPTFPPVFEACWRCSLQCSYRFTFDLFNRPKTISPQWSLDLREQLEVTERDTLFRRNWEISSRNAIWLFWCPNDPSKLFALIQMKFQPCQQVLELLIEDFQAPFPWFCWWFGHELKSMVVRSVANHRHVLCLL